MPLSREQFNELRQKGLSVNQILRFESGQVPQQIQQPKEKTLLQKTSGVVDKTLGRASRFMFGTAAGGVGSVIGAGAESAKELITGKPSQQRFTREAEKRFGTPGQAALTIGGTALEGTVGGFGEKLIAKVGGRLATPLVNRAKKLYQSALKPSDALLKKAPDVIETGLREGAKVSKSGQSKVQGIMEDIGEEIGRVIDTGVASGKSVPKKNLLPYLDEMKTYLGNSIGGKQLVREIDAFAKKIVDDLPDVLPIEQAQQFKKTTQRLLSKYYNKMATVEVEVKKQLTRGIKEEIAKEVPEIAKLNARDRTLFGLDEALGKSLKRIGNRNTIGLSDMFALGSGGALGGVSGAAGLLLLKKIFLSPSAQSARAILYNTLGQNGAKAFSKARIPVALGIARVLDFFDRD